MSRVARIVAVGVVLVCLLGSAPVRSAAQAPAGPESVAGAWEGVAQAPDGPATLKATLTYADGKVGGTIESSRGPLSILSGSLVDGKLTLAVEFQGSAGTLTGTVQGGKIEGTWEIMGAQGAFALARPGAAADPVTGSWQGEATVAGEVHPFSLVLRLSGDVVAGEIAEGSATVPFTSGSWKDGTLTVKFPYAGGVPVTMTGQIQDGKITGAVDYNSGEATGTFTASRKQ